ncbi:MAG: hypothetical protein JXA15_08690 [Spirochaetales bacterium]|nr:hypothetical protein [Spirochaetales bacterium]
MKKMMLVIALLAAGTMAFALGARESMTEDEALAALELKIAELELTDEEAAAVREAFYALEEGGFQARQALRLTEDCLDEGLRTAEMLQLSEQVRLRTKDGDSLEKLEEMVRERIRTAARTGGNGKGQAPGGAEGVGAGAGPGTGLKP